MTIWIGLTGGIGSGKSQVAACFASLGIPIIDADAINRSIINTPNHTALIKIKQHFGKSALDDTGCLNRQYMRELIFRQQKAKQQLEHILHPHIIQHIQIAQTQYHNAPYGIIELPTLTEHPHFRHLVQRILLIHSPKAERIKRVKQRSGLNEENIHAIINNQATDEQRLAIADDIIDNSGSLAQLHQNTEQQHHIYLALYAH
ncbi:MAG: dephospho-CoA kinase [Alysiella sp.]|uniref:dephospho-CoA kinase n=1 Tax=Alysiella sp. TaxID=1872483 RepID=UPI0026DACFEC|nr:dephospho-CoA kinase [Alysiella sp.]MDO4433840.1 dephospho-CoA kinase [Alysiella sp.]